MMDISLKRITSDNYEEISLLEVEEYQEDYIASNMWSLVEAAYNENYVVRGIYLLDKPVGFFMWVKENPHKIAIWRFMIDKIHQNKGLGRNALQIALNEIKKDKEIKEIEICYNPLNPVAKTFYDSFGFEEIGMDKDGDDMLALIRVTQ
ncbi:GNAT family N-acetyltransferase [Proteus terrae]|uniref:GNAT family N-acetyltransferase n=3 Tax=Proteus terrae TaxID=1574161 RepID=UPI001FC94C64|nr:GNAT family N-acetyltransferase [Proteus terrae]